MLTWPGGNSSGLFLLAVAFSLASVLDSTKRLQTSCGPASKDATMPEVKHKIGSSYIYGAVRFWAEGGVICTEDLNTGNYACCTREEFAARIVVFKLAINANTYIYPSERINAANLVYNAKAALKEAKFQGDPFDPKVYEAQLRHRRKSFVLVDGRNRVISHHALPAKFSPESRLAPPMPCAPLSKEPVAPGQLGVTMSLGMAHRKAIGL